jgi:putative transposase
MPDMQSAFLTVKFKLHNPSQRRRAMLLDAMRRAHLGYDKILKLVRPDVETIAGMEERKDRNEGYKHLQRRLQDLAKPLPLGNGPKQAIIADALAQAESYVELKRADDNTSYPTTPRLKVEQTDFDSAIDGIANSQTVLEENQFRDMLAKLSRPGIPRPLNILKNRINDGALILQDDKGRLFAFINLLPAAAKRKRQVDLTGLVDTRTGEVMSTRTSTGDLFPLEGGQWHMKKFMERGILQSSRLIFDNQDFYFACTFQFDSTVREPTTYLGIDRGIELLAAWSVVDEKGQRIDQGQISGERLRSVQRRQEQQQRETQRRGKIYRSKARKQIADEEVHKAANEIVAAAVKHNAQVVMEDLKTISMGPHQARPKGARKGGWRRMLTRAQYMKLKHYVGYRLLLEGFPPIRRGQPSFIEIHPAYTSVTCSKCGHQDKESRQSQALFLCTKCGHKENADINASSMVAGKGVHFDNVVRGRKKGQKLKDNEQFPVWYSELVNGVGAHENAS